MRGRTLGRTLVAALLLASCGGGSESAPDFTRLQPGMPYTLVAKVAGGECRHVHDRGVRQLEWHYEDGSLIEATILDGKLSGLEHEDGTAPHGRSIAATRLRAGVQADMPETQLRRRLGRYAVTIDDTSDRECRWPYVDGTLNAVFMRGELERARWIDADGVAANLVEADPVAVLVDDLASERRSDRYRALAALEDAEDPRIADALIELLEVEQDRTNREMAAVLSARAGDTRAAALLLSDLEQARISEEIIEALALIGDAHTEAALAQAYERVDNNRIRSRIASARQRIDRRIGRDWPPS